MAKHPERTAILASGITIVNTEIATLENREQPPA